MPELDLPLVGIDTSLRDAFLKLQEKKRYAIAVQQGESVGVVTAQQIIREAKRGATTIAEIEPVLIAPPKRKLGVGFAAPTTVRVTVGSATHALWLRGPGVCECDNPDDPHGPYFPDDDGKPCNHVDCDYHVRCMRL